MIEPKRLRKRAAANRKHFSETNVLRLPVKPHQYLIWDAGTGAARGLAILVSPTGTKSYRCVFYYPGSAAPHYKYLGRVGEMSLLEARTATRATRAASQRGEDPRGGEAVRSDTFLNAVKDFIQTEQVGKHQNVSAHQTEALMLRSCKPWLKRPLATIRAAEIDALLELLRDGNADKSLTARPYLSNRLFSHLRAFFSWAVKKRKLATSPMTDMEKPWNGAQRRSRVWFKGTAGDDAVVALWRTADELGGVEGRFVKLLLLTGKRKSALAAMCWQDIDAYGFWFAPPGSKTKRNHSIPLPGKAQQVLHPRGKSGLVFDGLNLRVLQDKICKASGIEDFFYHGVRHLLESKLAELKVAPHIRDNLFDHAPNRGSGTVYDHHQYRPEMLEALNLWADHIGKLVSPAAGVTRLR